jgi:hypothetical protein
VQSKCEFAVAVCETPLAGTPRIGGPSDRSGCSAMFSADINIACATCVGTRTQPAASGRKRWGCDATPEATKGIERMTTFGAQARAACARLVGKVYGIERTA